MRSGPVVLNGTDLFRFDVVEPKEIKAYSLTIDSDQMMESFRKGLHYEETSNDNERLPSEEVAHEYFLKRELANIDSDSDADEKHQVQDGENQEARKKRRVD